MYSPTLNLDWYFFMICWQLLFFKICETASNHSRFEVNEIIPLSLTLYQRHKVNKGPLLIGFQKEISVSVIGSNSSNPITLKIEVN